MEDTSSALTVTDVVARVRQRPVLAVAPVMLGLLLSVAYVVLTPPSYTATAAVKVEPVVADRYAGNINVANLLSMPTEMQVVQSTSVATLAAEKLGLDMRTVRQSISVDSPQDTQVLNITFTGSSPQSAQRGAKTVAEQYLAYSKETKQAVAQDRYKTVLANIDDTKKQIAVKSTASLQTQLDALNTDRRSLEALLKNNAGEVISEPNLPQSAASPKPMVAIPAGIGLGAIAGLALAVLWPSRNRRRATAPLPPRAVRPAPAQQPRRQVREPVPGIVPGRPVGRPATGPAGGAANGNGVGTPARRP